MKIISLGLGVQSTALYYMSSMGELPRVDHAIFVDPGREKTKTIQYLKLLLQWAEDNNGIPITVVHKKNLFEDLLNIKNAAGRKRFLSIPAYTKNEDGSIGMLKRQCTGDYKIDQVDQTIRHILNVPRVLKQKVEIWKGISLEEIDRLSIPNEGWKIHVYPFCNYAVSKTDTLKIEGKLMTRTDIIKWFIDHGLPLPPKSSCVFCPFQSDASWYDMKVNDPQDFNAAVRVDRAIRNSTEKGVLNPVFLHELGKPLEEIIFNKGQPDLWHGECSGNCHT